MYFSLGPTISEWPGTANFRMTDPNCLIMMLMIERGIPVEFNFFSQILNYIFSIVRNSDTTALRSMFPFNFNVTLVSCIL